MSDVPCNRFTPADRAAAVKRLCEAMAMETADVIPAHHRLAHLRSAAGATGRNLDDLTACEEAELVSLCHDFAATSRGELRVAVLDDDPAKVGTVVSVDGVNNLSSVSHALAYVAETVAGVRAAALYRHPAGGRFAPDLG